MGQAQRQDSPEALAEPSLPDDASAAVTEDLVLCVMSGEYVPRKDAVMVSLGPGRRRWIRRDLTNAGR